MPVQLPPTAWSSPGPDAVGEGIDPAAAVGWLQDGSWDGLVWLQTGRRARTPPTGLARVVGDHLVKRPNGEHRVRVVASRKLRRRSTSCCPLEDLQFLHSLNTSEYDA
jgi:hypothetical protein